MALLSSMGSLVKNIQPSNGTINVPVDASIVVSFSIDMVPATINSSTLLILDDASLIVPATVSYDTKVAIVTPTNKPPLTIS